MNCKSVYFSVFSRISANYWVIIFMFVVHLAPFSIFVTKVEQQCYLGTCLAAFSVLSELWARVKLRWQFQILDWSLDLLFCNLEFCSLRFEVWKSGSRNLVREIWFEKSGWPEKKIRVWRTTFLEPLFYTFLEEWLQIKWLSGL